MGGYLMSGTLIIHKAPPRKPRLITFGREVKVGDIEQPQIAPEMPEAVAEVQEVLAAEATDGQERSASVHNEIDQAPGKKRGRPKKERTDE